MFVFVEYYDNYNVIESDKTISAFKEEFDKYAILAWGRTKQQIVRDIQQIYIIEKYNEVTSEFISNYLDQYPEYKI